MSSQTVSMDDKPSAADLNTLAASLSQGEALPAASAELSRAYEEVQKRNDEFRRELAMARKVQATFIPQDNDFPQRSELAFGGYYEAMADVGGDIYDIIRIGKNAYGLIIADVSGHGVAAALVTALVKIAFRSRMSWGVRTDDVCSAVNASLHEILGDGERYVTAFVAILNLETGILEYTNAAHHPALLIRGDQMFKLDSDGGFLGIFTSPRFGREFIALEPGDRVYLYTDGIPESRSYLGEEYGFDRLAARIMSAPEASPSELVSWLMRDVMAFTMGAPPHDDRAVLCVSFNGLAPERKPGDAHAGQGGTASTPEWLETAGQEPEPPPRPPEDPVRKGAYRAATAVHDPKAALDAWKRYLDAYPDDARAMNNAGVILYRLGRMDEAEAMLRSAVIASPGDRKLLHNLALVSKGGRRI